MEIRKKKKLLKVLEFIFFVNIFYFISLISNGFLFFFELIDGRKNSDMDFMTLNVYTISLFISICLLKFSINYMRNKIKTLSIEDLEKNKIDNKNLEVIFLDFVSLEQESKNNLSEKDHIFLMNYVKEKNKDLLNIEYHNFLSENLIFITKEMEDKEWIFKIKSFKDEYLLNSEDLSGYAQMIGNQVLEAKLKPIIELVVKYNMLEYYANIEKNFPNLYKQLVVKLSFSELLNKLEVLDEKTKKYFYIKNNYNLKYPMEEIHWMQKYVNIYQKEIMQNFKQITLRLQDKDWFLKVKIKNEYKILKSDNIIWYSNIASPIEIKEKFKHVLEELKIRERITYKNLINKLFSDNEQDIRLYSSNIYNYKKHTNFLNSNIFNFKKENKEEIENINNIEVKNINLKNRFINNILDYLKPFIFINLLSLYIIYISNLNLKISDSLLLIGTIIFITIIIYTIFLVKLIKNIDKIFKIEYSKNDLLENIDIIEKDKNKLYSIYLIKKTYWLKKYFKKDEDFFLENVIKITNKIQQKDWLLRVKANPRKIIMMNDLEWYSNVVSKHKLYDYLLDTIVDIVEDQEYKYYQKLESVFSDIMHDKILEEVRSIKK